MKETYVEPFYRCVKDGDHLFGRYPGGHGLVSVYRKNEFLLWIGHVPVHINNAFCLFEYLFYLSCELYLSFIVRAINLCHQGLEHRGAWRDLGQFYPRPIPACDFVKPWSQSLDYGMALFRPHVLWQEIYLYIRHIRPAS